jgi:carbonic anhydrase
MVGESRARGSRAGESRAAQDHRPASPADALAELIAGNHRFVTGTRVHPNQDAEYRAALARAQRPFAVLFGCSDSRLAAEMIFDRGLGDLFVVRTAGHIIGAEVLASIEYGVAELGAPLVVVLGHDSCGAIEAAHAVVTGTRTAGRYLGAIIERVTPSIEDAHARHIANLDRIADVHVGHTIDAISSSPSVAAAVTSGQCAVVGMSYRLADGRATLITPAPMASVPQAFAGVTAHDAFRLS